MCGKSFRYGVQMIEDGAESVNMNKSIPKE